MKRSGSLVLLLCALLAALVLWQQWRDMRSATHPGLLLLIPDRLSPDAPDVRTWLDAAQEEGVALTPMPISRWVRGMGYASPERAPRGGVILPDSFHTHVSDAAITMLGQYVERGGKLLLIGDAGLQDSTGRYADGPSRLSNLAGVIYGNYPRMGEKLWEYGEILGASDTFETLGVPPGRYISSQLSMQAGGDLFGRASAEPLMRISGYSHELQQFSHLLTQSACQGDTLLLAANQSVLACLHASGAGKTLFVNLPLTWLKQRTDGLLLHGFLRYFAQRVVGLPTLAATPNGLGVVVLNWHCDDRTVEPSLRQLQAAGVLALGRQSFHFTAGPDVNVVGDKLGMDLPNNPSLQALIQDLRRQGHAIASHGGWRHNDYGAHASDPDGQKLEPLLALNHQAVTQVNGGVPPREYSAPMGNHPLWAHQWVQAQGMVAYYSVSNAGMGPTRLWMGPRRVDDLWAFPVMTAGPVATVEDAYRLGVSDDTFTQWLMELTRFIEEQRAMRLVYFHPVGAVMYLPSVVQFAQAAENCVQRGRCEWATMTEAGDFLNARLQVAWQLEPGPQQDHLLAEHPQSLARMSWDIPAQFYEAVGLLEGQARIVREGNWWRVRATDGKKLRLWLKPSTPH